MNKILMGIKDFYSINIALIEINKINVIGGVNGSGKSTASKILYSFLCANSKKRKDIILQIFVNEVKKVKEFFFEYIDLDSLPDFSIHDSSDEIINKYNELLKIAEEYDNSLDKRKKALYDSISLNYDEIIKLSKEMGCAEKIPNLSSLINNETRFDFVIERNDNIPQTVKDKLSELEDLLLKYDYIDIADNFYSKLTLYTNPLMNSMFAEDSPENSYKIMYKIFSKEYFKIGSGDFDFFIKTPNSQEVINNPYDYYFKEGFIENVFYIDNVSILDLKYADSMTHMMDLFNNLSGSNNEIQNEKSKVILDKIMELIKGSYERPYLFKSEIEIPKDESDFEFDEFLSKYFGHKNSNEKHKKLTTPVFNTASGIKQIGVVQLLLMNNKLVENSYLIIDEPEVNLHPEWQIKFAEILVLLVKELDIKLYLNSHSPMFIEAISLYSEYYDLLEDTNFYLTEKQENDKFNFIKIDPKDMGAVYENLTKPYDELDKLKAKILFKE